MARRHISPLDGLTAIRASIGVSALFTPGLVKGSLGSRGRAREELRYVLRIWGARNITFAVATRAAPPAARDSWLAANVAIDLLDAVSGAVYVRRARPRMPGPAVATITPLVAAGLGLAARRAGGPGEGPSRTAGTADP